MIGTQSKRFAMQHDIELTELRKHGTSNTTSRSTTTQIPLVTQSFHSDAKLGTATATRLTRAEGPRSINFPAKVLSTSRNKFARQALHVTCFFGIMTVVYEAVSLIPPFTTQVIASEALTLQASSSEEEIGLAKLAVVYDFLQECTDRKVRSNELAFKAMRGQHLVRGLIKIFRVKIYHSVQIVKSTGRKHPKRLQISISIWKTCRLRCRKHCRLAHLLESVVRLQLVYSLPSFLQRLYPHQI